MDSTSKCTNRYEFILFYFIYIKIIIINTLYMCVVSFVTSFGVVQSDAEVASHALQVTNTFRADYDAARVLSS